MDEQVGSLVLMSDYLAPTPLWAGVGACLGRSYLEQLGLPEPLMQGLLAWQDLFDAHYRQDDGWDSQDAASTYEQDGRQLQKALQEALPHAVVQLDLWPITGQAPSV
ncbi:hypothetical protein [Kineococcus sp. SYSU DK006]|uniref:hypothetical protein n=1 Tax=Kineococcus sp. SYSU DK006 TaxID=3383127 RepID=UPI003D7C5015